MFTKGNPSTFCHHYTRHSNRVAPTRSHSDTTSTDSDGFLSASEERRRKMTFAWAAEQEFLRSDKRGMTTEEWVKQQRDFQRATAPKTRQTSTKSKARFVGVIGGETCRVRLREGKAYVMEKAGSSDDDEYKWNWAQSQARSRIREEFKKMEEHLQRKQEAEREARAEREKMARAALEEKERRDRMKVEGFVRESWQRYEDGWKRMITDETLLSFESVPWPVMMQVRGESDLNRDCISNFLFSPLHSADSSRKERLKKALLRWHPDRFTRFIDKIQEKDKEKVINSVGIVVRILNDLII
ncbi:hypothetical protein BJ165DRAFT_951800 [Panaeolus papilionaceus]|nr:hypothetical protein BJ165DRAFT_951800 [Panaeolus papilionaceus]